MKVHEREQENRDTQMARHRKVENKNNWWLEKDWRIVIQITEAIN